MNEYSTIEPWQRIDENGVVYEAGSLMASFQDLPDPRKPRGKRSSLVTLLMLAFMAKLSGADTPYAIAEWCGRSALKTPCGRIPCNSRRKLG